MGSEDRRASPESTVTSLLATSGHLQSSLLPDPAPTIRYRDRRYASASDALDAYITDHLTDPARRAGKLQLTTEFTNTHIKHRNTDVLKNLTEGELSFLNIPVRRDSDRLSVTTDDLLVLPPDGSLPVTHTSALLSRSGGFPLGPSLNSSSWSHSRASGARKHYPHRSVPQRAPLTGRVGGKSLRVDDLLMGSLRSQSQAPPPKLQLSNKTHPTDTPRSHHLPRWLTSQKSEMDFSGLTSVSDLKYPGWLRECEESSDASRTGPAHSLPYWVRELEESSERHQDSKGHRDVKGHPEELFGSKNLSQYSLRELRLQFSEKLKTAERGDINTGDLFRDDKIGSLILKAEQILDPAKEQKSPGGTEDILDQNRSWDDPPVTFKSPVPVGGADQQPASEEHQGNKSFGSCSSGYGSRKHPGPVEALKHMLFSLQAVEQKINQSNSCREINTKPDTPEQPETETLEQVPQLETEESSGGESLQRALHHLDRLKHLVEDMNERKARELQEI